MRFWLRFAGFLHALHRMAVSAVRAVCMVADFAAVQIRTFSPTFTFTNTVLPRNAAISPFDEHGGQHLDVLQAPRRKARSFCRPHGNPRTGERFAATTSIDGFSDVE